VSGPDPVPTPRQIVIVDAHPVTGAGIATQLRDAGFHIAAVTRSVEEVPGSFDVAVCDPQLPLRSGPEAVAYLAQRGRHVLVTSGTAGPQEILDAVAIGAHGYLPKTAPAAAYARAVQDLLTYNRYVGDELAGMLLADARLRPLAAGELDARALQALRLLGTGQAAADVARNTGLDPGEFSRVRAEIWARAAARRAQGRPTARERELITLIADGCTRKEAAARMSISVMTVSSYLKAIKSKYLASHPGVPPTITPLSVARRWARESGMSSATSEVREV
jgi:DNA-binding NarL/FixJ family response regulator